MDFNDEFSKHDHHGHIHEHDHEHKHHHKGCGCGGHHHEPKPEPHPHHFSNEPCFGDGNQCLTKSKYLSEFRSDLEKKFARENIGLSDAELKEIVLGLPEELSNIPMVQAIVTEEEPETANKGDVYFNGESFYMFNGVEWEVVTYAPETCTIIDYSNKECPIVYSLNDGELTSLNEKGSITSHDKSIAINIDENGNIDLSADKDLVIIRNENKDNYLKPILAMQLHNGDNEKVVIAKKDRIEIYDRYPEVDSENTERSYWPIDNSLDGQIAWKNIEWCWYDDDKTKALDRIKKDQSLFYKYVPYKEGSKLMAIKEGQEYDLSGRAFYISGNTYIVSGSTTDNKYAPTEVKCTVNPQHKQYALIYDEHEKYVIIDEILYDHSTQYARYNKSFLSHIIPQEGIEKNGKRITILGDFLFGSADNKYVLEDYDDKEYAICKTSGGFGGSYVDNKNAKDNLSYRFIAYGVEFMLYNKTWYYL